MNDASSSASTPTSAAPEVQPSRARRSDGAGRRKAPASPAAGAGAHREIAQLSEAIRSGRLGVRASAEGLSREDAELVRLVNGIVETMARPLALASGALEHIAHGRIPEFIIEEFPGDFDTIKQNINIFLATMYGMHHEMQNLVRAIEGGRLNTRGNDWDFEGNWRELIAGVNTTLDAVIEPVTEAREVMGQLSQYDLTARMRSAYKGDHAKIKKALNGTATALHDAIAQVATSVGQVSASGDAIAAISQSVAAGAADQAVSIEDTSATLSDVNVGAVRTAENTDRAVAITRAARASVEQSTVSARQMITAMREVQTAAQRSLGVVREIDGIAQQTDQLAANAATQAGHVSEASRGFAVVAKTVRDISDSLRQAADRISTAASRGGDGQPNVDQGELREAVGEITRIALYTHVLAANASIEAAHVEATGVGLADVTEQVRALATRSKDAAQKTGELLQTSATLSAEGCAAADTIEHELQGLAAAVADVAALSDTIAAESAEQQDDLATVAQTMMAIKDVTQRNAEGAQTSSRAAEALVQEGRSLQALVSRFRVTT